MINRTSKKQMAPEGKNKKFSTLVVGSQEHLSAETCVDWGDNFYVGDYEIIIFNLPSLDYPKLLAINSKNKYYFSDIRNQIVEAQEKTNLVIICITDEMIVDEFTTLDAGQKINNYTWCPIIPIFEENGGKKIPNQEKKLKFQYLDFVKEWDRLFYKYYNNTGHEDGDKWEYKFEIKKLSYLLNNLDRDIAFGLSWSISIHGYFDKGSKKPIIFLPKIKDMKKGIDSLLNDFIFDDDPEPEWAQKIKMPGEEEMENKIEEKNNIIIQLEREKNKLSEETEKINRFKKLLYLQGKSLEKIVEEGLALLNVELKKLEVDNLEDRIFEYDKFTIPFEIRGKESKGLNEKDLAQLIIRIADRERGDKYTTRGVFVINHQRNFAPSMRGDICDYNIIKKAEAFNICILSTIDIFKLVNRVLSGEKIDIKEQLFNTSGLVHCEKNLQNKQAISSGNNGLD